MLNLWKIGVLELRAELRIQLKKINKSGIHSSGNLLKLFQCSETNIYRAL